MGLAVATGGFGLLGGAAAASKAVAAKKAAFVLGSWLAKDGTKIISTVAGTYFRGPLGLRGPY